SRIRKKQVVCYHGPPRTIRSTPRTVHAPRPRLRVRSSRARRVRGLDASPHALAAPPAPRSPSYLYPRAPRARRPPREREESVLPPRSAGFGRAQSVPRRVRRAYPHTRSRSLQRRRRTPRPRTAAALRTNVPRSPAHRIPASTGTWRIPERAPRPYRAGLVPVPPSAARAPRSRHPPPRVRGLGASPRALGAALLLALAPRTPRARRPPREREGSVQRPVALASFALSPRSPSYLHPIRAPRSPNPREYVSPRAHLHGICRLPAPRTPPSPHPREYGDTMPPRARSPHRPRRTAPRTCTPVRAQGVAAALASSHLDPPNAARARGVGRWLRTRLVARESSCSRGRRSRPASVYLDDTRRISARV
ncbi:hypothetical protein DFH09DRAFT_1446236, partial [Mycena vulgaris]